MGYLSRLPNSNEPNNDWNYGPQEPLDDVAALLNGLGKRCSQCRRVTMNRYLNEGMCPECKTTQTTNG